MALEDPDMIDGITLRPDGRPNLVIADLSNSADDDARWANPLTKLRSYVGYILSPDFAAKYPGVVPRQVAIEVVCRTPPSERMAGLTSFAPRGDVGNMIDISYTIEC